MGKLGEFMTTIARLEAMAFRAPVETPVTTSFGIMRDRPAVFVRVEDSEGAFGWGEAFANWPMAGAEHRVNLLVDDIGPLVLGRAADDPAALFEWLTARTHLQALQSGEWGPFRQVIAAIDIALWDLHARRAGKPLALALADGASMSVPSYASGIHIDAAVRMIAQSRKMGFQKFKVKVGFDLERDIEKLADIAAGLEVGERLFADANQAWGYDDALCFARAAAGLGVTWLEEPMAADAPEEDWRRLSRESPVALAGGENLAGEMQFGRSLEIGQFRYVQPDVAKWGGLTGCRKVARAVLAAEQVFCPHFLGGGVGLLASAHLLAAVKGPGFLEIDVNPNPLRDAFDIADQTDAGGTLRLNDTPGIGITEVPPALAEFETLRRDVF